MPEQLVSIVYSGDIIAPNRQQVVEDFARLFKLDARKAEKILSSSHRVLKKALPLEQAERFRKALSAIGVLVELVPVEDDPEAFLTLEPEPGQSPESMAGETQSPAPENADSPDAAGDPEPAPASNSWSVEGVSEQQQTSVVFAAIQDHGNARRLPFTFTGSGAGFFGIWIVNIVLTVLTLGIYSAWAKVRTHRYFYQHTQVDGHAFEYLGNPIAILKGRLMIVAMLLAYGLCATIFPWVAPVVSVLILLALPWLVASGLRFRMRNSAYRDIRFGFEGGLLRAFQAYPLMFVLVPLSLGLLLPYMFFLQNRYRVDNSRYGIDMFCFNVGAGQYYRIYLQAFVAILITAVVTLAALAVSPFAAILVVLVGYALVITFVQVETWNLMFDNSQLGDHSFSASLQVGAYFSVYFTNILLIVVTLGLFYPWARVRLARYRAAQLLMIARGSLDYYIGCQEQEVGALGEEMAEWFDIDIGF